MKLSDGLRESCHLVGDPEFSWSRDQSDGPLGLLTWLREADVRQLAKPDACVILEAVTNTPVPSAEETRVIGMSPLSSCWGRGDTQKGRHRVDRQYQS